MKIIIATTGKVVAEIMTNHSMSLDESIECVGEMHWNDDDNYQEVLINGISYDYDMLDVIA